MYSDKYECLPALRPQIQALLLELFTELPPSGESISWEVGAAYRLDHRLWFKIATKRLISHHREHSSYMRETVEARDLPTVALLAMEENRKIAQQCIVKELPRSGMPVCDKGYNNDDGQFRTGFEQSLFLTWRPPSFDSWSGVSVY